MCRIFKVSSQMDFESYKQQLAEHKTNITCVTLIEISEEKNEGKKTQFGQFPILLITYSQQLSAPTTLPASCQSCLISLPQHQEVQYIGHVMVLDREILACEPPTFIHQRKLQAAESWWPNLILDSNHLDKLVGLDTRMF